MAGQLDLIDPQKRLETFEKISSEGLLSVHKEAIRGNEYYVFSESGGPSADDVDLEVDLTSTSGRPQVNFLVLPAHLTYLPQTDLKSTSGRLGSLPRRHRSQCLQMTNGTWACSPQKRNIQYECLGSLAKCN